MNKYALSLLAFLGLTGTALAEASAVRCDLTTLRDGTELTYRLERLDIESPYFFESFVRRDGVTVSRDNFDAQWVERGGGNKFVLQSIRDPEYKIVGQNQTELKTWDDDNGGGYVSHPWGGVLTKNGNVIATGTCQSRFQPE